MFGSQLIGQYIFESSFKETDQCIYILLRQKSGSLQVVYYGYIILPSGIEAFEIGVDATAAGLG